jgi:hypothetical protein
MGTKKAKIKKSKSGRKSVSLSIASDIYDKYHTFCVNSGCKFSSRICVLIEKDLEEMSKK